MDYDLSQAKATDQCAEQSPPTPFSITVNGLPGTGKTAILLIILDALAAHGLLDGGLTMETAVEPYTALSKVRVMNDIGETISLRLRREELRDAVVGMLTPDTTNLLTLARYVSRDDVSNYGWQRLIASHVHDFIANDSVPAGTDEVSFVLSAVG